MLAPGFLTAHGIHRPIGQLHHMKSVKGHGCRRQVLGRAGDEGLGHVHAHHFDGLGLALVGLEVPTKRLTVLASLPGVA